MVSPSFCFGDREIRTVSLSDQDIRINLLEIGRCLNPQGCSSGEKCSHGAEVELRADLLTAQHVDNDWRHLHSLASTHVRHWGRLTKKREVILKCSMDFRYDCNSNLGRTIVWSPRYAPE